MNWYIEITGTSLSEEAKCICKLNGIFRIDQLVEHYIQDKEFSKLVNIDKPIQLEIIEFTSGLIQTLKLKLKRLHTILEIIITIG